MIWFDMDATHFQSKCWYLISKRCRSQGQITGCRPEESRGKGFDFFRGETKDRQLDWKKCLVTVQLAWSSGWTTWKLSRIKATLAMIGRSVGSFAVPATRWIRNLDDRDLHFCACNASDSKLWKQYVPRTVSQKPGWRPDYYPRTDVCCPKSNVFGRAVLIQILPGCEARFWPAGRFERFNIWYLKGG